MEGFRYEVTVQPLAAGSTGDAEPVVFHVGNHDDLIEIVRAVRGKRILGQEDAAALAIGLKLFMEVVLQQRKDPLFAPLMEPLRAFVGRLKAAGSSDSAARR